MQASSTGELVFDAPTLVSYLSTILTLLPGDVIATGTPGGVGAGRTPPRYLADGELVETTISGVGVLRNRCRAEARADAGHTTVSVTSMLPRVALEYGHTSWALATSASAAAWSSAGACTSSATCRPKPPFGQHRRCRPTPTPRCR